MHFLILHSPASGFQMAKESSPCDLGPGGGSTVLTSIREIHPLDPQPHRLSMLVPTVCAPRVTRCSLGKYWSRDWFRSNFSLTQGLWNQQAANPGVHMLSMTHSGVRQRNLMTHAQCPLPVYYSQLACTIFLYVSCKFFGGRYHCMPLSVQRTTD